MLLKYFVICKNLIIYVKIRMIIHKLKIIFVTHGLNPT